MRNSVQQFDTRWSLLSSIFSRISTVRECYGVSPSFSEKMAHNHPSGDPTPSKSDIEMTRQVAEAAQKLGIALHDHVIVGRKEHASFKALGLI